jgi:hypothetical protein
MAKLEEERNDREQSAAEKKMQFEERGSNPSAPPHLKELNLRNVV